MIRYLILLILCLSLSACAQFSGGAVYKYQYTTPDGKDVNLKVESTREVDEGVEVAIDPETGKVKVRTGAMTSGPNNTQVLVNSLVEAFMKAAQAGAIAK